MLHLSTALFVVVEAEVAMAKPRRTSFSFDNKVNSRLDRLAADGGTSKSEILRRAITLYDYLENEADGRIKFEKANGDKVELVLP